MITVVKKTYPLAFSLSFLYSILLLGNSIGTMAALDLRSGKTDFFV